MIKCVQQSCDQNVSGVGASRACLCWRGDERHLLIFQLQQKQLAEPGMHKGNI